MTTETLVPMEIIRQSAEQIDSLRKEIARVIVGQEIMVSRLLGIQDL